jgi:flagellar hook-basal body complex protein FliE
LIPISHLPLTPPPGPAAAAGALNKLPSGAQGGVQGTAGEPFKNILLEALDQVNSMQHQADQAVHQLVTGEDVNPAEVLTTLQKADISFQLMLQIRNKLVQAYQEVNNIRI